MAHHVGASFVSLAPTFFKSQSALTPPLLLSKPDPLPLGSGLVFGERYKSCIATRTTSEQALYRLLRFFIKIRARSRRCSSFPRKAGGFAGTPNISCMSLAATFFVKVTGALFRCVSSPKKVALRLCYSLVNALATLQLATNLFRGCEGSTLTSEKQITSFSCGFTRRRSFTPSLLLPPQSRRLCGDPQYKLHVACGDFFVKVTGALTPLLLLSEKGRAAPLLLACKRARNAPACYQPFSGMRGFNSPLKNR